MTSNPLEGLPLRYLIGTDNNIGNGWEHEIIESSYDVTKPRPFGPSIAYCNLFNEKWEDQTIEERRKYGPYLHTSDTAENYGEGQIDPNGNGFNTNLIEQLQRRSDQGFQYVELDNPDAYRIDVNLRAINIAVLHNMRVIAKNVGLGCDGDPADVIVSHTNVYGIIVEKGAGSALSMDTMRRKNGRPLLPVWFVFFGRAGKQRAPAIVNEIRAHKLQNMGVTYSSAGEYGNCIDLIKPNEFGPRGIMDIDSDVAD